MSQENGTATPTPVSHVLGNPLPTLVFTFTLIVIMIWATQSGIAGPDALLFLGVIPPVLGPINGILSLAVAVCGLYTVFADICTMGGVNVPKGPSIIK